MLSFPSLVSAQPASTSLLPPPSQVADASPQPSDQGDRNDVASSQETEQKEDQQAAERGRVSPPSSPPLPQPTDVQVFPFACDKSVDSITVHATLFSPSRPTAAVTVGPSSGLPLFPSCDDCVEMVAHALEKEAELPDRWVEDLDASLDLSKNNNNNNNNSGILGAGADTAAPARPTLRGFFSRENLTVAAVPFVCGMINGYTIGYVAPYTQLYKTSTNCALYTAQVGCEAVPFADCVWRTTTTTQSDGTTRSLGYCGWPTITCREAYPNDEWMGGGGNTTLAELNCLQDRRCTWSYSAKECQNPSGYTTSELGIFAGSMIAGNMFGAILGGPLVTSMGTRLTFLVSGLLSVVCSVMGHVDAATDEFWVLVTGRFVLGIFMGLITVACPLYVNTNAAPLYRRKLGTLFQVFTTFGVFLAGTIGLGVGQSVQFGADDNADITGRMQGLACGQTALSLAMIFLGVFSAESRLKYGKKVGALNQNEYSYRDMMGQLFMSVVVNGTMRMTGFNAILNFAPTILGGFGLAPLVGNTVMTVCNFLGTLISIPLDSFFSIRSIFLFGSCFISCMCLFLCGIPVYPGVASESVTNNCAVVGICLYIFAYEVLVGPNFYVLCQEIFPPSFRPRGNSFAQLWQFIFNLVINVCYPIAAERFSGGPGGNQHKGQSIIFIFFGGVGIVCFVIEFFFLKVWNEVKGDPPLLATAQPEKEIRGTQGDASDIIAVSAASRDVHEAGNRLAQESEIHTERDMDQ